MKRPHYTKTISVLLLLFAFFSAFAQKEIYFRLNLKEGACFEVQSTYLSQSISSEGKEKQENKIENTITVQYNVVKKTPAFYSLNFMYTDYYSTMKMGMKEITTNPKTADMLNFLAPSTQIAMIMNKPFFANISPQGKILSIKENKSIAKEFEAKTKKLSPDLREQVYTMVNALVGNESLVALIKSWTSYIPDSAVKIGDKWSIQKDSSVTNYAFITETDSTYVIEGVGNRKTTMTNKIQGMVLIVNYEEEFTTTIEIDKHTFLPKIITTESEVLTKSEMPDYPTFSMPPSQSYSTSTLKISNCR